MSPSFQFTLIRSGAGTPDPAERRVSHRDSIGNSLGDGTGWPVPPWKFGAGGAAMTERCRA